MNTFEAGKSYTATIPTAGEGKYEVKVLKRTAKFVTIQENHGEPKRVKVCNFELASETLCYGAMYVSASEPFKAA